MRLIDADESLKRINDIFPRRTESDYQKGIAVGMAMAKVAIHEQPTVDAEPVRHGRWVMVERGEQHNHYQCSECGQFLITSEDLIRREKYCYTCGAKMDGERRNDE